MAPRLPKGGPSAASLFSALTSARRGLTAQASIRANGAEHNATISPLGARRYLVRLAAGPAEPLALPSAALEVLTAFSAAVPPPPKVLDAFAAASPFGAALLEGRRPSGGHHHRGQSDAGRHPRLWRPGLGVRRSDRDRQPRRRPRS